MAVQKFECSLTVNLVPAVEELNLRPIRDAEVGIQVSHDCVFVGDPFVRCHAIVMPTLNHKWSGRDQPRHLRIVKSVAKIELWHLIFAGEHIAVARIICRIFDDPLVEIRGTDRQRITVEQRRNAHSGLATVGESVESDPFSVYKGLFPKPRKRPFMLAGDSEKSDHLTGFALRWMTRKAS